MAIVKTRIANKHDLEVNWQNAADFVPLRGEIIIYDAEVDAEGRVLSLPSGRTVPYTYARQKIGDGTTLVGDLPFINDTITDDEIDEICSGALDTLLDTIAVEEMLF